MIRLCKNEGRVVVRTLKVNERSLYSMHLVIFNQCSNSRMGVMWLDLGALTTTRARELWICWSRVIRDLGSGDKESCSSQVWSEQWKW